MSKSHSKVKAKMEASNSEPSLILKLLIDKKTNKVLFAESNKQFVDFLFSLFSLPLGTIVKLLKEDGNTVGSIGDLFGSIESLDDAYFESSANIKSILNPNPALIAFKNPLLLSHHSGSVKKNAYMCLQQATTPAFSGYSTTTTTTTTTVYHPYVSDSPLTACPSCNKAMNFKLQVVDSDQGAVSSGSGGGGFVKGVVTYMIMDNLEVKPLSTIASIALINSFNIRDLSSLEEMIVRVGSAQAIKILREALQSKNVLTSVFLNKEEAN